MTKTLNPEQFEALKIDAEPIFKQLGFNPVDCLMVSLLTEKTLNRAGQKRSFMETLRQKADLWLKRILFKLRLRAIRRNLANSEVVFFITEPTHHKQCFPVALQLHDSGTRTFVISTKPGLLNEWKEAGIDNAWVHQSFGRPVHFSLPKALDKLIQKHPNLLTNENVGFLKRKIQGEASGLSGLLSVIDKIARASIKNQVWMIGNDLAMFGRLITDYINKQGGATYTIQHGTIPDDPIHARHLANKIMVFGNTSEERLLEKGINKDRIIITGAPYTDELLNKDRRQSVAEIEKQINLQKPAENRVLILFSGPGQRTSEGHHIQMIQAVVDLARQFSGHEFIIKLHRKDKPSYYDAAKNVSNMKVVTPSESAALSPDIFDWLTLAPAIITGNSAAGSEAILMGKHVFTLDLLNEFQGVDYKDEGVSFHADSIESLISHFNKYVSGTIEAGYQTRTAQFNQRYFYKTDGQSASRVASELIAAIPLN